MAVSIALCESSGTARTSIRLIISARRASIKENQYFLRYRNNRLSVGIFWMLDARCWILDAGYWMADRDAHAPRRYQYRECNYQLRMAAGRTHRILLAKSS